MKTAEIHTVDSVYMIEFGRVPNGFRVKDLSGDTAPHTYTPPHSSCLHYYTRYGVWRRTTGNGKWEFASDKSGCGHDYRPVIIRECGIPQSKEEFSSPMPVPTAKMWHDAQQEKARANADRRWKEAEAEAEVKKAIEWCEKAKKEVKKKMGDELQLIDVIFFNKKTEVIDYRENIVAQDTEEAYMIAANDFGKYSSKVHIRRANCILGFCSVKKEE